MLTSPLLLKQWQCVAMEIRVDKKEKQKLRCTNCLDIHPNSEPILQVSNVYKAFESSFLFFFTFFYCQECNKHHI